MAEIEPELHGLGEERFRFQNLPDGGADLEEGVDGGDGVGGEHVAEGREMDPGMRVIGARGVRSHEDRSGEGEAEGGEAEEEDEDVEAAELLLGDCGLEGDLTEYGGGGAEIAVSERGRHRDRIMRRDKIS